MPSAFVLPVACLALPGLRFSEWAALTVGDIITTLRGAAFRIHRAMPQSLTTNRIFVGDTKGHRSRTVPIPAVVLEGLRARLAAERRTSVPDAYRLTLDQHQLPHSVWLDGSCRAGRA